MPKITKQLLRKLGACSDGREWAFALLPVEIHVDPEKNWALACKLADIYANTDHAPSADLLWMLQKLVNPRDEFLHAGAISARMDLIPEYSARQRGYQTEPLWYQQALARIAEQLP